MSELISAGPKNKKEKAWPSLFYHSVADRDYFTVVVATAAVSAATAAESTATAVVSTATAVESALAASSAGAFPPHDASTTDAIAKNNAFFIIFLSCYFL